MADTDIRHLLEGLHQDGLTHDAAQEDRLLRRRNLEPEAAALLSVVLQAMGATTMVEIGTSNGYSAIWFAAALARRAGRLVSVDVDASVQVQARTNLEAAGLAATVELRTGDGGAVLADLPDAGLDVLFLDSERPEYPRWWPHPVRALRVGGLLAVDNVLSHPDEVAEFRALVEGSADLESTVVPVGKGLLLATRLAT
ncbi:Predicted O-methyltransferase YrrM [Actinopolymorpha cephalotaxi]|uniref:O-methyltransferase YrrM n=1 Tax=Actinopolymorpha cephalotaxi TaxID=504797 RepID=A0A1I2LPF1_9ACTN|nr:class I SAM-dependent methyltransferase [Actinopolymorpha cephalotaxi]NYH81358.1 putative O-methyltransferase YrrM [Actinopolymorpha cephalotaxi]SFF80448.1 Predicted O-methyltransferase YrrM [Actinopolymorpha cephalotaxi]